MSVPTDSSDRIRVLGVLAHPDDECIFGWPAFQNPALEKSLIMLVSDRKNPERRWCARRLEALEEICGRYRIRLTCLHLNSEFYRLPYRRSDLVINHIYQAVNRKISEERREFRPDFVFCHNPHGEYGMFDHRMVFDIVYHHSEAEHVCITDLCGTHADWPSFDRIPARVFALYYEARPNVMVTLDQRFFETCKRIYDRLECWTWKDEAPPATCRLYLLSHQPTPEILAKFQRLATVSAPR